MPHEKQQLIHRLPAPFLRHILGAYRHGELSTSAATAELQISRSRFYEIYSSYLRACAQRRTATWSVASSGGNHHPSWPTEVTQLLVKLLSTKPPCSYSAAASELYRRLQFKTDRASVRRWAIQNNLAPDTGYKRSPQPVKRWQAQDRGALWQYDASPHHWLLAQPSKHTLLNLLDDATRFNIAARLYYAETLLAHFDFLERAFRTYGLPLALYVDYHSFFFTHTPEAFTQLGAALHFYGVALRYAPTPQAKGKIERRHHYFQNRLPALFAAEKIVELESANALLEQLVLHANRHEIHREIGTTPKAAWDQARQENRSVLRPAPKCPWWPYVFSQQTPVRVGDDGKVPVGQQRCSLKAPPRSTVIRCLRPDGDIYFLRHAPNLTHVPTVLLHCPAF